MMTEQKVTLYQAIEGLIAQLQHDIDIVAKVGADSHTQHGKYFNSGVYAGLGSAQSRLKQLLEMYEDEEKRG